MSTIRKYLYFLLIFLSVACFLKQDAWSQKSGFSLQQKWISEKVFKVPESVCFDAARNIVYVANINGAPTAKDGNGFISKLGLDGKVIQLKWITGLDAPKGMGIFQGKLYVTDIDQVIEIDIEQSKVLKRYPAANARFLNDISITPDGKVFISDMQTDRIYLLEKGEVQEWLIAEELTRPNGLFVQGDYLLVGCGKILKVNLVTKKFKIFIPKTGSIDGLVAAAEQKYLISDWSGRIHMVQPGDPKILLLDLTTQKMNAADIDYIPSQKLLLIPTFSDNRVVAYDLLTSDVVEE